MKAKKNMIIGVLCLTLVFMGLGYAAFSSILNLSGTATASGAFDVKITNVELDTTKKTEGAVNQTPAVGANYAVTEQNLIAKFSEPGDYITWNITVTNRGTIEAAITVDTSEDTSGPYKLSCDAVEGTVLAPSATTTFACEMSFDKNRSLTAEQFAALSKGTPVNMTVSVTAVQSTNYEAPTEVEGETKKQGPWTIEVTNTVGNTEYGTIVKFDSSHPDATTNIVVPYSVDGVVVKEIDGSTFSEGNSIVYEKDGSYLVIITTEENYNEIKAGWEELDMTVYDSESEIPEGYELMGYFNFDLENKRPIPAEKTITSIDFRQATELEIIGATLLYGAPLTSINFGSNSKIKTIGTGAFADCRLTGALTIPASVTSISNGAFAGNYNGSTNRITSLVFESNSHLEAINEGAFEHNALTGTLTIPASVISIGEDAFEGNTDGSTNQIISLVFENNSHLESIGEYAFRYNAITGTLTIPASVISIGEDAFEGNTDGSTNRISSLVFENNSQLQTIGFGAFRFNALAGTLIIPNSVTSIKSNAFYDNSIEELHLGSNITNIGTNAFYMKNSTDLKDVYVDMTESNWNNNVTKDSNLFNGTPTMHYN